MCAIIVLYILCNICYGILDICYLYSCVFQGFVYYVCVLLLYCTFHVFVYYVCVLLLYCTFHAIYVMLF